MTPDPTPGDATGVLYIGALGRSGSTLLNLLLTTVPGFFAAGELRYLWDRGLVENQLCGCGSSFRECEFWGRVGEVAFGGWDTIDGAAMVELDRSINRNRRVVAITRGRLSGSKQAQLREYRDVLGTLFAAIEQVAAAKVIVDSSKTPAFAAVLAGIEELEVRVVHLLRDPRGVAFSRTKQVKRPEIVSGESLMGRFHPIQTAALWLYFNTLFEWLRRRNTPTTRLRYEDLADDPDGQLDRLLSTLPPSWQTSARRPIGELTANHTVSGNPLRFERGALHITRDDAWRSQLPRRHRLAVTMLAAPLLGRYGYGFRS